MSTSARILDDQFRGAGVALTVGFVGWLLRGGALLSAFLSSMPLWRGFDPLVIVQRPSRNNGGRRILSNSIRFLTEPASSTNPPGGRVHDGSFFAKAAAQHRPAVADNQPDLHRGVTRLLAQRATCWIAARATVSGALAVQLAGLASRNDAEAIKDTIDAVVSRGPDLLSIAIRDVDGHLVAASPDHARLWRDPPNGKSTPTDVQVPLLNGETEAGRIELVFRPLAEAGRWFGLS